MSKNLKNMKERNKVILFGFINGFLLMYFGIKLGIISNHPSLISYIIVGILGGVITYLLEHHKII